MIEKVPRPDKLGMKLLKEKEVFKEKEARL